MIIKNIVIKDTRAIIITDTKQFEISIETYLSNRILKGEEITQEEIDNLVENNNIFNVRNLLINKIARKKLSCKECEMFLKDNGLSQSQISEIINEFKRNHLIDDTELTEFMIDYYLVKKKGINVIKEKLIERKLKVSDEFINNYMDFSKYRANIVYLIEKYSKLGSNKSNRALSKFVIEKLINNGYNQHEFIDFLKFKEVDESVVVNKEIEKFFKFKTFDDQNIAKITKKLLSKGFKYDIIKEAIRSVNDNEIN